MPIIFLLGFGALVWASARQPSDTETRGKRFTPRIGAQRIAPEAYRPMAIRAVWNQLEHGASSSAMWLYVVFAEYRDLGGFRNYGEVMAGYPLGTWVMVMVPPTGALGMFDDYTSVARAIDELTKTLPVMYWAVLEVGASAPRILRDSGQ